MTEKEPYDVLDLKALRCFWAAGRLGSLTRAGIELGISEAAVSQRIKSLEGYLGTKLYESRGGKIRLTAAGQHTLDMSIVLFDKLQDFEIAVSERTETETLTLSAHDAVLRYLLPNILVEFTRRHPLTHIRLLNRRFSETVQLVQSNEADLGVIPEYRMAKDLVFHPLQTYEVYLILARDHPLLRNGTPKITDLLTEDIVNRYPLILAEADSPEGSPVKEALSALGLPFNVRLEAGTVDTLKHYVSLGLGLGIVTGLCLTEEDNRSIVALPIPEQFWKGTTFGVVYRGDKHLSAPLAALLELMGVDVPGDKS